MSQNDVSIGVRAIADRTANSCKVNNRLERSPLTIHTNPNACWTGAADNFGYGMIPLVGLTAAIPWYDLRSGDFTYVTPPGTSPDGNTNYSMYMPNYSGGDNYTQNYHYSQGSWGTSLDARWNYPLAKAKPFGQRWRTSIWWYNDNSVEIPVNLRVFFVDAKCSYNHSGYVSVSVANGGVGTGGSHYYSPIILDASSGWTHHTFDCETGDIDWISLVTVRIEHDLSGGTSNSKPIYCHGWKLGRMEVSITDLMDDGYEYNDAYQRGDLHLSAYTPGVLQNASYPGETIDNDDEANLLFFLWMGDRFCFPEGNAEDTSYNSNGKAFDLSESNRVCRGAISNAGTAATNGNDANWPDDFPYYGGFFSFDDDSQGIMVTDRITYETNGVLTVNFWITFDWDMSAQQFVYLYDAQNSGYSTGDGALYALCNGSNYISTFGNLNFGGKMFYDFPEGETYVPEEGYMMITAYSPGHGVDGAKLYINSVEVTADCWGAVWGDGDPKGFGTLVDQNFIIGHHHDTSSWSYSGLRGGIGQFGMWKTELTAQQISEMFWSHRARHQHSYVYGSHIYGNGIHPDKLAGCDCDTTADDW